VNKITDNKELLREISLVIGGEYASYKVIAIDIKTLSALCLIALINLNPNTIVKRRWRNV